MVCNCPVASGCPLCLARFFGGFRAHPANQKLLSMRYGFLKPVWHNQAGLSAYHVPRYIRRGMKMPKFGLISTPYSVMRRSCRSIPRFVFDGVFGKRQWPFEYILTAHQVIQREETQANSVFDHTLLSLQAQ